MASQPNKIKLNVIRQDQIVDNSWTIKRIATERYPTKWKEVFEDAKDELQDISDILEDDKKKFGQWYPDNKDIFRAFHLTSLDDVRVVIIGQDPYPGINHDGTCQAQGMSFSVKKGTKIPSSLKNIFKELKNTVKNFKTPNHGDLTSWARQGVLLLNSCLTVRPGAAGSHKELWLGFIKKAINGVLKHNPNCIFIMWGRKAQKIKNMVGGRATILEAAHPSGFSCYRGFFGCDHFNEVNKLLREKDEPEINWNL